METKYFPKCKALITMSEMIKGRKEYRCWACGLQDTYPDMVQAALFFAKRKYQDASRLTCHFCGEKKAIWYDLHPAFLAQGSNVSVAACRDCRPEVAPYLLQIPAGLFADGPGPSPARADKIKVPTC